jgi:MFS family permease
VISVQTGLDGYRLKNFYLTNMFQGFVWMIFHFSVIYFFTFLLGNVALVGIFLGFAHLIAFFLDIPLGIIQRYIPTKRMFIIGAISQLIAVGIFLAFIFKVFSLIQIVGGVITPESLKSSSDWFFWNGLNWIGVLIASICYGLTKEINDVATYGYILSHANPSEYGTILSRNNITFWIGSITGLVSSGILLNLNHVFSILILAGIIIGFLAFIIRFFDNTSDSISLQDIQDFKVSIQRFNTENVKEYLVETIKKTDLEKIIKEAKYIIMKPKQQTGEDIPWKKIYESSKNEFIVIWKIFSYKPLYTNLLWTISLVLVFWFWDTFASSFLLDFLNDIKYGWSYILLAIIGIPWIVLQEYTHKLWERIGIKTVGMIWLWLSWISLLIMWLLAATWVDNPVWIVGIALINSIGYACGMATGQNQFLDTYNRIYAKHSHLTEIDANASSGPMKIVQNFANVIGLVFGWILISLWFPLFFFIFGTTILVILAWTILNKEKVVL